MSDEPADLAMRDMEAASDTIAACRAEAGQLRQTGMFDAYIEWLEANARAAERWLLKAGPAYPAQVDAKGRKVAPL